MTRPAVKQLHTAQDLIELRHASAAGVTFVLGLGGGEHAAHASFAEVARIRQNAEVFGATDVPEVLRAAGLPIGTPFVAKLDPDELPTVVEGVALDAMDSGALLAWVKAHRFPQCSLIGRTSFYEIANDGKQVL